MSKYFSKYSLIGWCLFDFANSIPAIIGGIYFAKWFTEDLGSGSTLYNILFFVSAVFILLTGKWVGTKIDKNGYQIWIKISSLISIIAILSLFISSQLFSQQTLIVISFILFLIFLFGYQVSRICHNVYLRAIIPVEIQSKMSGYGAAANWAGSIIGILLTIPFITKYPGTFGRELTFLIAGIGYGVLTPISLFLMFRSKITNSITLKNESINLNTWKEIILTFGTLLFIFLLLFDVMATVQRNLPPFLTSVFGMSDDNQAGGFLLILLSALIGGLIASKTVNFKNSIFWLKASSLSLFIAVVLITVPNIIALWTSFVLAGISYGILESTIRINFMGRFSQKSAGKYFGVLAVIERTSGIIGPLLWIIPFSISNIEKQAYIFSMLLMAGLTLISFIFLFSLKKYDMK